ncbi:MAG TPA: hypothetical protein VHM88_00620, partial [Candidatus Acidoferrales bacterium]|nr:hypothetical protein [Candidatus Acidoferrales bacterium]
PTALYYASLSDHYNIPEAQAAAAYNGGPTGYNKPAAQAYQLAFNAKKAAFSQMVNCIRGF